MTLAGCFAGVFLQEKEKGWDQGPDRETLAAHFILEKKKTGWRLSGFVLLSGSGRVQEIKAASRRKSGAKRFREAPGREKVPGTGVEGGSRPVFPVARSRAPESSFKGLWCSR